MKFRSSGTLVFLVLLAAVLFVQSRILLGQSVVPSPDAPPADDAAKRLQWLKSRMGANAAPQSTPSPSAAKKRFADTRGPELRPLDTAPAKVVTPKTQAAAAPAAAESRTAEAHPSATPAAAKRSEEVHPKKSAETKSATAQTAETRPATPRPKSAPPAESPASEAKAVAARTAAEKATSKTESTAKTDRPDVASADAVSKKTPAHPAESSPAKTGTPKTASKESRTPAVIAGGPDAPRVKKGNGNDGPVVEKPSAAAQTAKAAASTPPPKSGSSAESSKGETKTAAARSGENPPADKKAPKADHPETLTAANPAKAATPKGTPADKTGADASRVKKGNSNDSPAAEKSSAAAQTAKTRTPESRSKGASPAESPAPETKPVAATDKRVARTAQSESQAADPRAGKTPPAEATAAASRPLSSKTPSNGARNMASRYPWKANIVTTVFWIGEPVAGRNFTPNYASSWDAHWTRAYGGYDNPDPDRRRNYIPVKFVPRQNPFYVALPYNDVTRGTTKPEARLVIPWFKEAYRKEGQSICRDRWVAIRNRSGKVGYAQWSDCGPFRTDHWQYVFGMEKPKPNLNHGAGLDVSPALRDYLGLQSTDVTDWKFVDLKDVPNGPWALYGDNNTSTRLVKAGAKSNGRKVSEVAVTRVNAL